MPYILENMTADDINDVARIERLCFSMPWPISAYRRELKTPDTNRYIVVRYVPPEVGARLGLATPTIDTLTTLTHKEFGDAPTREAAREHTENGNRSLLASILPWMRPGENGRGHDSAHEDCPIVGYAGVWLMVDEAHVTTIGVHPDHRGHGAGELLFMGLVNIAQQMRAMRMTLEVRISNTGAQALYMKYGFENAGVRKRYYSDNGEDAYIMWSEPLASPGFQDRLTALRAELVERMIKSYDHQVPPSRPIDAGRLQ